MRLGAVVIAGGYGAVLVGSDYARAFGTAVIAGAVMGLFL